MDLVDERVPVRFLNYRREPSLVPWRMGPNTLGEILYPVGIAELDPDTGMVRVGLSYQPPPQPEGARP